MTIHVHLLGDCHLRVWGLTPRQRLERMLRGYPEAKLAEPGQPLPASGEVMLLRADYVYDERVLQGLMSAKRVALQDPRDGTVVAARADSSHWGHEPRLEGAALEGLPLVQPETMAEGLQSELRKSDRPWVAPVTSSNRRRLEKALFNGAYKGVTDFITRWVWPAPARKVTAWCAHLGLKPNHVTALSYVLTVLAGYWFWQGDYGWGLLAGWIMTFLDTVDGKLARVTITSSKFGNLFDHALDLVHPPFWYLAWGVGLGAAWHFETAVNTVIAVIFAGYIAGRLCEGAFRFVAPFSMFIWRPFDSVNRLFTARRNPNLLILTLFWMAGRGDTGLVLVAAWTLVSTLVLAVRLAWGGFLRSRGVQPEPWLSRVDARASSRSTIEKWFAPGMGPADV